MREESIASRSGDTPFALLGMATSDTGLSGGRQARKSEMNVDGPGLGRELGFPLHADAILGCLQDALIIRRRDGEFLRMNPAALRLLGLANVDEARETWNQMVIRDARGNVLEKPHWPCERSLRGETFQNVEVRISRAGHPEICASCSSSSIDDEHGTMALSILSLRDVTAERRAEQARLLALESASLGNWQRNLVQDRLTLRAIVEGSPIAMVTTSPSGLVEIWNPVAEKTLGYRAQDVTGKPCPLPLEHGIAVHDQEVRAMRADGTECEIICSSAPMRGANHETLGNVLMFSDITERNRMKRRMEHTRNLESLGVLAGGVAHDFNNLLTGIMGNASLALYSVEEASEARPLLEEIVRSSERAATLTQQLLAYAGKGRLNAARLDLTELARETVSLSHATVPNHSIRLELELDHTLPEIVADRVQLQQVILSLMTNGMEAIGESRPGTILVKTRTEMVSEPLAHSYEFGEPLAPGHYAVLEISDDGGGMDEATRARIFEPFFSTKFTGRGLGLSSVLGIVRQHQGTLEVKTSPGAGSTFRVLLPVSAEAAAPVALPTSSRDLRGDGLILVVDDEETVRRTVRRSLERLNYQVVLAENGQAAIEAFSRIAGDVRAVLLDLTMPVMGGEEALRHLVRIRPDVQVILTSGHSEAVAMKHMRGKGVAAFLQKPFNAEQVGQKLRDLLRKSVQRETAASEFHRERESVGDR